MKKIIYLILLLLYLPCSAITMQIAKRHDVFSPNGQFVLDVNPDTEMHYLYKSNDRTKPLFSLIKIVSEAPFFISNDGKTVVHIPLQHISIENIDECGVTFWNKDGMFKIIKIVELCPNPPKTEKLEIIGPIGDFWRTWYYEVINNGKSFTVKTTEMNEYEINFSDGKIISKKKVEFLQDEEDAIIDILNIIGLAAIPVLLYFLLFLIFRVFYRKNMKDRKSLRDVIKERRQKVIEENFRDS